MKRRIATAALCLLALTAAPLMTHAADQRVVTIDLTGVGPVPEATGTVNVINDPFGPDRLYLQMEGLPPNTRITLFLTQDAVPGGLPARFLGEFTTNRRGRGRLHLLTEIVDAFASANQLREDEEGVAPNDDPSLPPPGVHNTTGGSANTIPLDWLRGYMVTEQGFNVFGPDEKTLGAAPVFVSTSPLQSPGPLVINPDIASVNTKERPES